MMESQNKFCGVYITEAETTFTHGLLCDTLQSTVIIPIKLSSDEPLALGVSSQKGKMLRSSLEFQHCETALMGSQRQPVGSMALASGINHTAWMQTAPSPSKRLHLLVKASLENFVWHADISVCFQENSC